MCEDKRKIADGQCSKVPATQSWNFVLYMMVAPTIMYTILLTNFDVYYHQPNHHQQIYVVVWHALNH